MVAGRGGHIVEWHELQCPARDPRCHDQFESRSRIAMSREDDAGQGSPSLSAAACWARKCSKGDMWLSERAWRTSDVRNIVKPSAALISPPNYSVGLQMTPALQGGKQVEETVLQALRACHSS